ncbi:hypothetical protein CLV44_103102 [Marinobacterium halophilum]|uniref:Uncharacterized protein n=1 Tax=Marinobacterium halophilum TaxID=267374 RepID=A0A2P8F283_9GAMM|nr:hypothetical protein CLV44_103102 [Marinobacterium halophilum]
MMSSSRRIRIAGGLFTSLRRCMCVLSWAQIACFRVSLLIFLLDRLYPFQSELDVSH